MSTSHPGGGATPAMNLLVIERILRDRDGIWQQIVDERDLRSLISQMVSSSALSLALYGAVLGASYGWQQILSSLVKLPLLFLATLAICLPTLYLFNLVFGARLSMIQAVALILVSITVTAALSLAFAPVSLFFLVTAQSYEFYKLLNVSILILTAIVGLRFLVAGMRALNDRQQRLTAVAVPAAMPAQPALVPAVPAQPAPVPAQTAPAAVPAQPAQVPAVPAPVGPPGPGAAGTQVGMVPAVNGMPDRPYLPTPPALLGQPVGPAGQRPASMGLVYIWIMLFGFVGTQLAWTLRPFFGDSGSPFALFREVGGTFYADLFHTIGRLFGG
ncbi:hypothetical protein O7632_26525 [Solwaraspora sp. WMMD406]|uniref:hypothetical protein n=1 Tax=Solwaraspora sp. WMMD406 TaxID=3016095 RepID=UPI002415E055|nr:hypothetical protein [Solwaraspora sp. WMMD406]MDG4767621.1 hypothetical protein [Solwaraspora sp. WMMD406]